jgi:predicted RNase H-like nuclease (RuvC/YqgF family)
MGWRVQSVNHVVSELTDEELPIARPTPRPAAVREGREPKSVTATVLAAMAELEDLRAERSQLRREVDELKDARTRLQVSAHASINQPPRTRNPLPCIQSYALHSGWLAVV